MKHDRREHIAALDYMLRKMQPPEPYKSAIEAAKTRLMQDEAVDIAERRTANDWPYCPKCGAPYVGMPTDCPEVRNILPGCKCHVIPEWGARPSNNEWEYCPPETVGEWNMLARVGNIITNQ